MRRNALIEAMTRHHCDSVLLEKQAERVAREAMRLHKKAQKQQDYLHNNNATALSFSAAEQRHIEEEVAILLQRANGMAQQAQELVALAEKSHVQEGLARNQLVALDVSV